MMSRITLHLRKQARSNEGETDFWDRAGIRSRLRFTHTGARSKATGPPLPSVSVTVEETSVMHDDRGNLLRAREPGILPIPVRIRPKDTEEEWYEMADLAPPQPARLDV